ncbi:SGNH/GDSL hydrolase family protein [Atlantibacter subterraneus]|uniref:SGNH/GDSL hydrolase family protein n=1 Tax=Atlantibacter subterraneus TaxID=255519 RepID=UPI00289A6D04|nr:SGNH/GDSL hydrolase family protein [Atlantibacter subterranea]
MKINKYLSVTALCWLMSCCVEPVKTPSSASPVAGNPDGQLMNYGDPAWNSFATKLTQSRESKVHLFQLGDSHTAADLMSGPLRDHFQQKYGDGGPGFISPLPVPGNRYSHVHFSRDSGWALTTSRKNSGQNFSLGGNIAQPIREQNQASFSLTDGQASLHVQALYRTQGNSELKLQNVSHPLKDTGGQWVFSPSYNINSPVSFSLSSQGNPALGGWMLTRPGGGVILSAAGINGAQISMLNKWQSGWQQTLAQLQPDMVILAYGTNEAFNDDLDINAYQTLLTEQVSMLRRQLPDTVIMLIGPGSSVMHKQAAQCAAREPAKLRAVVAAQRDVARQEKLLFWDWYSFMGGPCGIDRWAERGLARPDRVHLSADGYKKSADALWEQFDALVESTAH